jgi:protein-S-isoprenylcysteine O-methyltransferase Ste14
LRNRAPGAFLFRNRGWLPVPLLASLLVVPPAHPWLGAPLVAAGLALRLWAAGHIGLVSRTRAADGGPLVQAGPYARVRNPLYLANLSIFFGLGVVAWPAVLWMLPPMLVHYHLVVRWEEAVLFERLGAPYAAYLATVPRWLPRARAANRAAGWSLARAARSERGTWVALLIVLSAVAARWYSPA